MSGNGRPALPAHEADEKSRELSTAVAFMGDEDGAA